ncbi:MAG: DUF1844 domain-containing protein [Bdellovibrionales bacterium]
MENKDSEKFLEPSFSSLVISMATSTVLKMGLDPSSKEEKDLKVARYNIDLLEILQEKTKNNLSPEENQLLENCLKDLKFHFIQLNKGEEKGEEKK